VAPPLISYFGFFIYLTELLLYVALMLLLLRRWRETKVKAVGILFGAYFLSLIFLSTEFWIFFLNANNPIQYYLQEENVLVSLFPYFGGITAGFFLLFIDFFEKEHISPIHAAIYGVFIGAFILNILHHLLIPDLILQLSSFNSNAGAPSFNLGLTMLQFLITTNFPAAYFVIYVVIITLVKLTRIKKTMSDTEQKRQIFLMQLTIIFYYCFTLITVVISYQLSEFLEPDILILLRHIIPHLGVIAGGVMIFQAYIRAPVGFLQYQRVEKLLVVNKAGLLLFSYDFDYFGKQEADRDLLISGGVFAILNLFTEMIQTKNVTMIRFQDKHIALSYHESFLVILIAERITGFLWNAIDSFGRMFNLKYGSEQLELAVVPKAIFDDAVNLVDIAFGRN
jgi:hypothetical protein